MVEFSFAIEEFGLVDLSSLDNRESSGSAIQLVYELVVSY